jgi:hypothetical protein
MRYRLRTLLIVLAIGPLFSAHAAENEVDPTGTWKWRLPNQSAENTIKLKLSGDKLSGSVLRRNNQLEVPIEDATYKAGAVKFRATVIDEHDNTTRIIVTFSGRLSGDTIMGTIEFKHPSKVISRDWLARRAQPAAP